MFKVRREHKINASFPALRAACATTPCRTRLIVRSRGIKEQSMQRITEKDLIAVCERINRATKSPLVPWVKTATGCQSSVGNYHLSFAYGGVNLERMVNDKGGVANVFGHGHVPKRELYEQMHAFLRGLEAATPN